jgi:hypothetical protein
MKPMFAAVFLGLFSIAFWLLWGPIAWRTTVRFFENNP